MRWNFGKASKKPVNTPVSNPAEQDISSSGISSGCHSDGIPRAERLEATTRVAKVNGDAQAAQKTGNKTRGLSGALAQLVKLPRQFKQAQASFAEFKAGRSQPFAFRKKEIPTSPPVLSTQVGQDRQDSMAAVSIWLAQSVSVSESVNAVDSPDCASQDSEISLCTAPQVTQATPQPHDQVDAFSFNQLDADGSTARFGAMSPSIGGESPRDSWHAESAETEKQSGRFLKPGLAEDNGSNIPCVAHSAVSVEIQGKQHYIHANRIHTENGNPVMGETTRRGVYVAGQSPRKGEALKRLLTHAIDSKQGVFQIIRPDDHRATMAGKSSKSMLAKLSHIRKGEILGERYKVESLEREYEDDVHACYLLTVRSVTEPNALITVPLTQLGLKFDDKLLRTSEIENAHCYLEKHVTLNSTLNEPASSEPVVISQAGVGRSATVIVYNALIKKIECGDIRSENALDRALEEQIATGRQDRGPQFIHSGAQREELRAALRSRILSTSRPSPM